MASELLKTPSTLQKKRECVFIGTQILLHDVVSEIPRAPNIRSPNLNTSFEAAFYCFYFICVCR